MRIRIDAMGQTKSEYFINDYLGSPVVVADAVTNTVNYQQYQDPFGERIENNVVMQQNNPSWAIYTDNGTQFVKVTNNLVWDALYIPLAPVFLKGASPYFSFGGCGVGPITYTGNYSLQSNPAAGLLSAQSYCGGHPLDGVTVPTNNLISSLSAVPTSLTSNAGIEAPYSSLLKPAPLPTNLPAYTQYPK
jgi:hypothetical protein